MFAREPVDLMIVIGIYLAVNMLSAQLDENCGMFVNCIFDLGLLETIETMVSERPYYIQMGGIQWKSCLAGNKRQRIVICLYAALLLKPDLFLIRKSKQAWSNIWKGVIWGLAE